MFEIKTELRLHFHPITDMSHHVRSIVSPFTKVATNIKFNNIGRPAEGAQINFLDDNLIIVLNWDFMLVATIGKTTDLEKPEERFIHFFELFEKVQELETYNDLRLAHLNTWDLIPNKYKDFPSYKDQYLKDSELIEKYLPEDVALVFEGNVSGSDYRYSCRYGPLKYPRDVKNHDLTLFNKSAFDVNDSPKSGCLVNMNMFSEGNAFDRSKLASFLKQKHEIIETISQ